MRWQPLACCGRVIVRCTLPAWKGNSNVARHQVARNAFHTVVATAAAGSAAGPHHIVCCAGSNADLDAAQSERAQAERGENSAGVGWACHTPRTVRTHRHQLPHAGKRHANGTASLVQHWHGCGKSWPPLWMACVAAACMLQGPQAQSGALSGRRRPCLC